MSDPLHVQARAASVARAADRAEDFAARLSLSGKERAAFVAILAELHHARITISEFRKQHRNVSREDYRRRLEATVPAPVLEKASAASMHKQLRDLLGEERYLRYVALLENGV